MQFQVKNRKYKEEYLSMIRKLGQFRNLSFELDDFISGKHTVRFQVCFSVVIEIADNADKFARGFLTDDVSKKNGERRGVL